MTKEISFQTNDGLTLKGYSLTPSSEIKAVIALIHGMGEHGKRYKHVAEFFANHGIATVSLDLRGHGISEGKRGHTPSYDMLMNDIELFLKLVKDLFPNLPVFIYGHSMGGNLSLNFLIRNQPQVQAAIITSPYLKLAFEPPKWKVVLGKLTAGLVPTLTQPTGLDVNAISRDKKEVEKYVSDPFVHDKITSAFFVNVHFAGPYAIENASKIKIPLLIMHGLEDKLTSPDGTKEFMMNADKNTSVKYWKGLYHEIHNEPEKEEVLEYMINWIRESKIIA